MAEKLCYKLRYKLLGWSMQHSYQAWTGLAVKLPVNYNARKQMCRLPNAVLVSRNVPENVQTFTINGVNLNGCALVHARTGAFFTYSRGE